MKDKTNKSISIGGRLAYGVGDFAGNLLSGATASFISLYYTDSVLASALFVGTMMIIVRILDALSDLVMGYIIDHTHAKIGKARFWFIVGIIPLIVSFYLMFNVPASLTGNAQRTYIVVTYILNTVLCMTIFNVSYSTLCTYMSSDIQTRIKLTGTRTFFATLAMMLANIFTANILSAYGFSQKGYTTMVLIYGGISTLCLIITALVCKEEEHDEVIEKTRTTLKDSMSAVFGNRYILTLAAAFIFNWMLLGTNGGFMVYYVRDILGNMGLMGAVSAASFLPALVILALGLVAKIARKTGKRKALIIGGAIEAAGFLVASVFPASVPTTLIGMFLKATGMAAVNSLLFATVTDVAVYTDITRKGDYSGITNSVTSFGMKVGIGLGSALVGWLLAWGKYDPSLTTQTAQTMLAEKLGFAIIPCVCAVIVLVLMSTIDVEKKLQEMNK